MTRKQMWYFLRYDVWEFFRNIWRFRKTLCHYRTWDWVGLYQAIDDSLAGMQDCHENHSHLVNGRKTARKIKIARAYLKRLIDDDYYIQSHYYIPSRGKMGKFIPKNTEQPVGFMVYMNNEKSDREQLFKMLHNHSKSWWD